MRPFLFGVQSEKKNDHRFAGFNNKQGVARLHSRDARGAMTDPGFRTRKTPKSFDALCEYRMQQPLTPQTLDRLAQRYRRITEDYPA
jgi:hypothetical protein